MNERISVRIRPATTADAQAIAACVADAYRHYIARIGRPPRPMVENYTEVIERRQVSVADLGGEIVGVVVLAVAEEGFLLDNIAVRPSSQGKGIGKALLKFAESEARRLGHTSIYLYTNEKMTENQSLYAKIGYVEYARRSENGYHRVYMRKQLT
jgi:GNAT superfamily N-acetyltransferase